MLARTLPRVTAGSIIGALIAGVATVPAQAQTHQQPVTVTGHAESSLTTLVPFGDLALTTSAGRAVLEARVDKAVGQVCPDSEFQRTAYNLVYDVEDCRSFAWAGARPQMRHAIDLAKSGQAVAMAIEISAGSSKL